MHLKSVVWFGASLILTGSSALMAQRGNGGRASAPGIPQASARPAGASRSALRTLSNRTPLPASYTGLMTPGLWTYNENSGGSRYNRNNNSNRSMRGNFGTGYAGFYGTPYLPYLDAGFSSYSGFSYPSYSEQAEAINVQGNAQAQEAIARQMDQMDAEIRQLRENQFQSTPMQPGQMMQPGQPQWSPAPASPVAAEAQPPQAPIVLILQNGVKVSVNNYAVMDGVIWDFSKQQAHKYPVATVNLVASERATQETGGEFPLLTLSSTKSAH